MNSMFWECSPLKKLNFIYFNTVNIKNINCIFFEYSSLIELNFDNFDTNSIFII